ncbi:cation transport ATPase [Lacticaseibacillus casei A2-362]|nr:cation transport ATPase [Lacticaseibacillus casei A2-362]
MAEQNILPDQGLSTKQVEERFAAGQHNLPLKPLTRSISQIIKVNTFTLFNLVNVVLGALIVTTGSYKNLLFLGVAVINTAIGTIQEIQAKHQIDKMSILAAARATVIRDGKTQKIELEQLVMDDMVHLKRGDQIPVDGVVVATNGLESDESPLTGESRPITKKVGDKLLSGAFIVSGQATMQVTAVGAATFAAKLALAAKAEKGSKSQLLATINRIIRVLTYVLIPIGAILFTVSMIRRGNYNRAILTTSAAMIGMIPEGLVLLTNVALAVSARNLAVKRVLVRALPAIEALARVDTICLDKTGTITSGKLKVAETLPMIGQTEATVTKAAAAIVYALNDDNETAMAIKAAFQNDTNQQVTQTMPFSSPRKWSGAVVDGQVLFMGAPQFTFGDQLPTPIANQIKDAAAKGYRVLAIGTATKLVHPLVNPQLLGLILITDELRPTAINTFDFFKTQGVALKVISGDDPITVANIAKQARLEGADQSVDMSTIADNATAKDYQTLVKRYNVFGRVTPEQKKSLIMAYQALGHTVAMTGDGVNDVLALRQSDCSIAMASGADAASSIADFVLLDSNFDAMTGVLNEGRRVINNIERVASMYLVKTMYSVILATIFVFLPLDYPIVPINLTPVSAIGVAIPSFFLTLEPNFERLTGQFMQKVMTIAAPAAISVVIYTLLLTWMESFFHLSFESTSSMVAMLIGTISLNVLLVVARPFNRLKVGLLGGLSIALFLVFFVFSSIFSLVNLWQWQLALIYLPLMISTVPFYLLIQEFLGRRVLSKINWR